MRRVIYPFYDDHSMVDENLSDAEDGNPIIVGESVLSSSLAEASTSSKKRKIIPEEDNDEIATPSKKRKTMGSLKRKIFLENKEEEEEEEEDTTDDEDYDEKDDDYKKTYKKENKKKKNKAYSKYNARLFQQGEIKIIFNYFYKQRERKIRHNSRTTQNLAQELQGRTPKSIMSFIKNRFRRHYKEFLKNCNFSEKKKNILSAMCLKYKKS